MQKRMWFIIIGAILLVFVALFFLKNLNLDPGYTAELSVRGKPSEDIWKKWNEYIY